MAPIRRNRKKGTAPLQDAASSGHADRVIQDTTDERSQQIIAELSLEQMRSISVLEHNKPCLSEKPYNENDLLVPDATSSLIALEKNPSPHPSKVIENVQHEGASTLGVLEKNPSLRPCRVMGNVRQQGTSASEATTGPVGESEAMRKWREIKQNGFLSDPHGGMPTQPPEPVKKKRVRRPGVPLHPPGSMPMPHPQHGKGFVSLSHLPGSMPMPPAQYNKVPSFCLNPPGVSHSSEVMQWPPLLQSKGSSFLSPPQTGIVIPSPSGKRHDAKQSKRKEAHLKRNAETTKREQADKFKSAPPIGLLSGLNIGVIRRIRNPKQVSAILEAMVHPENPDAQMQSTFTVQVESGSNENEDAAEDQNQFTEDTDRASLLQGSEQRGKRIASDNVEESSPPENTVASPSFSVTDRRLPSATAACSNTAGRQHLGDSDSSAEQAPSLPLSTEWRRKSLESHDTVEGICRESTTSSFCMLDHNKELPLVVTTPSDIITMACGSDFCTKQENIFTLS
ncbi:uncharacterized protein M6B38_189195 [Iris pallida]|uniref:Uncharacterized protein n=1 Tax=Iris pallida TaxID=29817 RepID=A0AAX6EHY5_IRIPA|nr:uncharacterized protein M6B38_189195 [Iris pallida]